ncbi:MAG: low-specificity L-threonine aldolase [Chloroflexi bacterium]|nr:MAG: low-specificity L-threonine aldolase [Chloroflexota bacterium]
MDRIDFRSDTVSWPTPAMRTAMANAELGDDVYGEDPTVNQLEALAAAKVGKEAGLFVASGTMGNLVAILAHANRGDEAILGEDAHTFCWEAGGMATLGGVVPRPLPTDFMGRMDLNQVESSVRGDNPHLPHSQLILVENSYGGKGGYPIPADYFAGIQEIANRHDLNVHMDGARFFNAVVALGIEPIEITQHLDSITFCLSKGLSAPVGSVLCGSHDFIKKARRARKVLGGGMRQAGVLAAAGIVSLNEMIERLADDHKHARQLAEGLSQVPGVKVDLENVKTNMVFFELDESLSLTTREVVSQLRERANIWLGPVGSLQFRAVTHYWIGKPEVDLLLETLQAII